MKHKLTGLTTACLLTTLAGAAVAKNVTVSIPMSAIQARSGERGDFYVVNVAVPDEVVGKRLDTVVVEFAVDVSPLAAEDTLATPLVGVYPLTREYTDGVGGEGSAARVDPAAYEDNVSSARPVVVGQDRVLRFDITDIVKGWMREPTSNHGLVIGSLAGPTVGSMYLMDDARGSGAALRVTFFYQDRFGGRVSAK